MPARAQSRRRAASAILFAFPSGDFLLGSVPADSTFADLVLPSSQVSSRAGFRAADRQNIINAVAQGYIPAYSPCNPNAGPSVPSVVTSIGMSALKLAPKTGAAAPFVAVGGAIATLFGSIFGAHAAAVGREQAALCAAIPAANQFINQIDQAFQSGQLTAGQAGSLLDQVQQQYQAGVAPILKMSSSACNAACVYLRQLQAIVAKRKAQYQDAAAQQAQAAPASTSIFSSSTTSSPTANFTAESSGSLLPWAAAAAVLFLFLKGGV
jgi:hypothetical protein